MQIGAEAAAAGGVPLPPLAVNSSGCVALLGAVSIQMLQNAAGNVAVVVSCKTGTGSTEVTRLDATLPAVSLLSGAIAVHAFNPSSLQVSRLEVTQVDEPTPEQQHWVTLLPTEAMTGAGAALRGVTGARNLHSEVANWLHEAAIPQMFPGWQPLLNDGLRFGAGFQHNGGLQQLGYAAAPSWNAPMLKYNFIGTAARLWSPRGPNFGTVSVILDGQLQTDLSLFAADWEPSAVVWSWSGQRDATFDPGDPQGLRHAHAVVLRWISSDGGGTSSSSSSHAGQRQRGMVADSLDFLPYVAVPAPARNGKVKRNWANFRSLDRDLQSNFWANSSEF